MDDLNTLVRERCEARAKEVDVLPFVHVLCSVYQECVYRSKNVNEEPLVRSPRFVDLLGLQRGLGPAAMMPWLDVYGEQ